MKINIQKFLEAIASTEAYKPPIESEEGVKYLYDRVYVVMTNGEPIRLCDINFNAFSLSDVEVMEDYYDDIICHRSNAAYRLAESLRRMEPKAAKAKFI